ncbi:MAG: hypothetical protein AMXMBFR82_21620 [Candidatus Hydrogenedentota bacterium]
MPNITVETTGLVFRNPVPNVRPRQAYFPSVVELPNREILAAFELGSAMENVDVRLHLARSGDGGATWSEPVVVFEYERDEKPVSTLGRMSRLKDGTLVAVILLCDRSRHEEGLANPVTEGYVETTFAIIESTDGGRTWSAPRIIDPPIDWSVFEICSPILEVSDTRWMLPTSLWKDWDGNCPHGMKAVTLISDDRGRTWNRCVDVFNQWDQHVTSWEQKQTRLSDGRWLAMCWAHDYTNAKSLPNRYAFSSDDCFSYSLPSVAPLNGETCTPLALPDNRVLFVYRRFDQRGLWAHLAEFEGETWKPLADAPLWGADRALYGKDSTNKLEEMRTLRFGFPQCVHLSDRAIFVAFWCVEDCVACIRWFRLRVEM